MKFPIFFSLLFCCQFLQAQNYGWLTKEEHKKALDWSSELIEKYKLADSDILFISVLNSISKDGTPTGNDNYGRPIGTSAGNDTIITTTVRQRYHYCVPKCPGPRYDENSSKGGWMKRSFDGGMTWNGGLIREIAGGTQDWGACCGRAIGALGDTVFIGVPEGLYRSDDRGKTWEMVNVFSGIDFQDKEIYLAPEIRWHPKAGMVLMGHKPSENKITAPPKLYIANSVDNGVRWNTQWVLIHGEDSIQWAEPSFCNIPEDERFFIFGRQQMDDMPPAQGFLSWNDGKWEFQQVKYTDIPWKDGRHDTHGIMYNPQTDRFEAAISYRSTDPENDYMSVKLYSIPLNALLTGSNHWRYDGLIHERRSGYGLGKGEGQHTGGIAVDDTHAYVSFGSGTGPSEWANSYIVRRTLQTDKLRRYLTSAHGLENLACDEFLAEYSDNWSTTLRPVTNLHDYRWDIPQSTALSAGTKAWVIYDFQEQRELNEVKIFGNNKGAYRQWNWMAEQWTDSGWKTIFKDNNIEHNEWMSMDLSDISTSKLRITFEGGIYGVQVPELMVMAKMKL